MANVTSQQLEDLMRSRGIPTPIDKPAKAKPPSAVTQSTARQCVTFAVPVKTKTEGNANENRWTRINRAKQQRAMVRREMIGLTVPALPVVVTMTRHSPATMDDDNLPSALKHCRDQIAAEYGVGDSPRDPIVWKVEQAKCSRGKYGVTVKIERAA